MKTKVLVWCAVAALMTAPAWLVGCIPTGDETEVLNVDPQRARARARETLLAAAEYRPGPWTRTNALEALASVYGQEMGDLYVQALDDESPSVRFAAIMVIGDTEYAPAKDQLLTMFSDPEIDRSAHCAVCYALYRLAETDEARKEYAGPLGYHLQDADPEVKRNAAMVMGKIGHPSAIQPLKDMLDDVQEVKVKVNIVEALAKLGDAASGMTLEGYCVMRTMTGIQLFAIQAMSELTPEGVEGVLLDRFYNDDSPRVRVAAAGGLARIGMGDDETYDLCVHALYSAEEMLAEADPENEVRDEFIMSLEQLAALSLGRFGRPEAVNHLYPKLDSKFGQVRVAAARSILQLLPESYLPPRFSDDAAAGGPEPAEVDELD